QILINGKYKSHVHRVLVSNYRPKRISLGTSHRPSIEKFVAPAMEFVNKTFVFYHHGMTYSKSMKVNNRHEIEGQSYHQQLRMM
ncbi:hypothetical protein LINGRAPRIM_LOCUS2374, partial [Linum grandiflorum]